MPENKDKLTEKEILDKLEGAFFINSEVYIQLKEIVKEHFGLKNWTCTFEEYYALPEPIRKYLAALETRADPPSMVRENVYMKDLIKALVKKIEFSNRILEGRRKPTVTRRQIDNLRYSLTFAPYPSRYGLIRDWLEKELDIMVEG